MSPGLPTRRLVRRSRPEDPTAAAVTAPVVALRDVRKVHGGATGIAGILDGPAACRAAQRVASAATATASASSATPSSGSGTSVASPSAARARWAPKVAARAPSAPAIAPQRAGELPAAQRAAEYPTAERRRARPRRHQRRLVSDDFAQGGRREQPPGARPAGVHAPGQRGRAHRAAHAADDADERRAAQPSLAGHDVVAGSLRDRSGVGDSASSPAGCSWRSPCSVRSRIRRHADVR